MPAESAFVTAFWISAVAALAAAVVAGFVTPRRAVAAPRVAVETAE